MVRPPEAEVKLAPPVTEATLPVAEPLPVAAPEGAVREAPVTVCPAPAQAAWSWAIALLSSSTSVWVTPGVSWRIQLKQPICR
jgi:hypothetical protein